MTRTITPTHVLLNQVTLAASASSVTFSNIPQTYGDLVLIFNGASVDASVEMGLRYNLDSGSNYTSVYAVGDGSSTGSGGLTRTYDYIGIAQTNRTMTIANIMEYSASDKHKTRLSRCNVPGSNVYMWTGRWANTSPITSIQAILGSGNFASGCTFSLYGVYA